NIDTHVAPVAPAQFLQPLHESNEASLSVWIIRTRVHQHADAPHALGLLRQRPERPRRHRATEKRDELAPPHVLPSAEDNTLPHRGRRCRVVHHSKFSRPMSQLSLPDLLRLDPRRLYGRPPPIDLGFL